MQSLSPQTEVLYDIIDFIGLHRIASLKLRLQGGGGGEREKEGERERRRERGGRGRSGGRGETEEEVFRSVYIKGREERGGEFVNYENETLPCLDCS